MIFALIHSVQLFLLGKINLSKEGAKPYQKTSGNALLDFVLGM